MSEKWAAIVPLIGGLPLAMQEILGQPPKYVISYPGFWGNDQYYMKYMEKKGHELPYLIADKDDSTFNPGVTKVNYSCAIPPCAGLSMLNSQKGGPKGRGSDAEQNSCMYYTSEFVLKNLKPIAHIGESAPGLSSEIGKGVVERLRGIAFKHGYTFQMIRTNTNLHGIPQSRPRTFYIFWRGNKIPKLPYIKRPMIHIRDFIDAVPETATHYTDYLTEDKPSDNLWYQFVLHSTGLEHPAQMDTFKGTGTVLKYIVENKHLDEAIEWLADKDKKIRPKGKATYQSILIHMKKKMERGLGYWDGSPIFYDDQVNAVISKNVFGWMHYVENRYFSIRELMSLMGLPNDFDIDVKKWNILCQNVPVDTARDWCQAIKDADDRQWVRTDFMFINNITQTTTWEDNDQLKLDF